MRPIHVVFLPMCLLSILFSTLLLAQSTPVISAPVISPPLVSNSAVAGLSHPDPASQAKIVESYGKLPLSFEENHGQADARVKFLSRTGGYTLFLTGNEAVLAWSGSAAKKPALKGQSGFGGTPVSRKQYSATKPNPAIAHQTPQSTTGGVLRMKLRDANPAAKVTGLDEMAGTSNYFIGNDPAKWRAGVPTYAKVKYEGIYSGIDLVYYGNQRQLEYDFIVAPGVDPHQIGFNISGAQRIRRDERGDLVLKMKMGVDEIRWHKPVVYQEKDGARQEIAAHYAITATNRVEFAVAKYDASRPLYIDPLIYSTYLGGSDDDFGEAIAVDSAGSAYVTGFTRSTNFPTTTGAFQTVCNGGGSCDGNPDAFVAKLNATGSALVYSTYLGGSNIDAGESIKVDSAGNAYVSGYTYSTDFPTVNALQSTFGGGHSDAFVAKINPAGSALVYSTYLGGGGDDVGLGIAADNTGNAYVTGQTASTNFPTMNPLQPTYGGGDDAFVAKINPAGSALVYSTYLGGSAQDFGVGIAVDGSGSAYITGYTTSTNFPTKNPLQAALDGSGDAFMVKVSPEGSLVYSTYLGGSGVDSGQGIAVDSGGNAYITGSTNSTDFPTVNPFQSANSGGDDAFVTKINPSGSALVYSTYLGSGGYNFGSSIAVDGAGDAYVTGQTAAANFPTTPGAFQTGCVGCAGGVGFVTELTPLGSGLVYSTYLGGSRPQCNCKPHNNPSGIALDSLGSIYVTGFTITTNFPTKNPWQAALAGGWDAFVAKFMYARTTTVLVSSVNPSVSGKPVTFTATVSSPSGGTPTGKVTFRDGAMVLATKLLSGGTVSFATSTLPPGPNSITAVYGGDANFSSSASSPVNQFVLAATTTTVSSSPNPSTYGQAVTFVAVVTSSLGPPPDGETVAFKKGTTVLGTGTLTGGSASFTTTKLPAGTDYIRAVYGGDSNFAASTSKAVSQVVNKAPL